MQDLDGPVVASAYVKGREYNLPGAVIRAGMVPGQMYFWRIRAFDGDGEEIGRSLTWRFSFEDRMSYVPGRILVVTSGEEEGRRAARGVGDRFGLAVQEEFELKSLGLRATVFVTEKDILPIIGEVKKEKGIIIVQPDYLFRTFEEPLEDMQGLSRILGLPLIRRALRGRGVTVAVVDTGVDVEHRDLADRIKTYENFVDGQIYRAEMHGTAVAGVIGASLNDFGVGGVAPESNIAALRACHQLNGDKPAGECSTTSLVKAIDSAIRLGARVVNMSYGSAVVDGLIARLIEKGTEERVLFVAPVGNNRQQKSMMFPASHPAVVSVAGIGAEGAPLPNPDVASKARVRAPAENIFTTIPGNRHNFLGGTSLASAAVSGLLALAVERNGPMAGNTVPSYQGEFCSWEESLLKLTAICGRGN